MERMTAAILGVLIVIAMELGFIAYQGSQQVSMAV